MYNNSNCAYPTYQQQGIGGFGLIVVLFILLVIVGTTFYN